MDVRYDERFPRAQHKPQPSLTRRLLWLMFCAVPAGVTRLRYHQLVYSCNLLLKRTANASFILYNRKTTSFLQFFCYIINVRYDERFPRAQRKPQPSLSRRLLWLTFCAVPAGVTRLRYHQLVF